MRFLHFFAQNLRFYVLIACKKDILNFYFFTGSDQKFKPGGIRGLFIGVRIDFNAGIQEAFLYIIIFQLVYQRSSDILCQNGALLQKFIDDPIQILMLALFHP